MVTFQMAYLKLWSKSDIHTHITPESELHFKCKRHTFRFFFYYFFSSELCVIKVVSKNNCLPLYYWWGLNRYPSNFHLRNGDSIRLILFLWIVVVHVNRNKSSFLFVSSILKWANALTHTNTYTKKKRNDTSQMT